jgi:AcrR family transcriptional regulator
MINRTSRKRQTRTDEILDAAWKLAARDGLGAISLRDLADLVDLRQPSLYNYFDSKLGLYDAMFAQGNRQIIAGLAEVPTDGDARSVLDATVEALLRLMTENVVRFQLLFQRSVPGFEPSAESYSLAVELLDMSLERLAAAGVTRPEDVDLFTALISGLANQQMANDPGGTRWIDQAPRAVEMLLTGIDRDT